MAIYAAIKGGKIIWNGLKKTIPINLPPPSEIARRPVFQKATLPDPWFEWPNSAGSAYFVHFASLFFLYFIVVTALWLGGQLFSALFGTLSPFVKLHVFLFDLFIVPICLFFWLAGALTFPSTYHLTKLAVRMRTLFCGSFP